MAYVDKAIDSLSLQPHKLIHKEQSQLSLAPSLLMLEVNPRIQKWDPDQDITKGSQLIGQWQFAVHVGPGPMDHDLDTLVIDR